MLARWQNQRADLSAMELNVKALHEEISDVIGSAVAHLHILAEHIESSEHESLQADLCNINKVVSAIQDLANEYVIVHDALETETIKASILRYKLKNYPQEIKEELQRAVNATRSSNATELSNLNSAWQTIEENIRCLEQSLKQLNVDTNFLVPERDDSCKCHSSTINQLNQCLSDKAALQIILNETREHICHTNDKIVELENGIIQLQEDMIKERAIHRQQQKQLNKYIHDTTLTCQVQKQTNEGKKLETDELLSIVIKVSSQLHQLTDKITELSGQCNQLELKETNLQSTLDDVVQTVSVVKSSRDKLYEDLAHETANFVKAKAKLDNHIKELNQRIASEQCTETTQEIYNNQLLAIVKEKVSVKESDQLDIKELNKIVQQQKAELAKVVTNTAQLHQDIHEMEQSVTEMSQSHGSVVESLKKVAEECRKKLSKERQERMELDTELEDIEKGLEYLQSETKRFQDECRRCIIDGKKEHEKLTQDGQRLQLLLKECQNSIQQMQQQLIASKQQLQTTQQSSTTQVLTLQQEMSSMKKSIQELTATISGQVGDYAQLESRFEQRTAVYNQLKKDLVAKKNKKSGLEDTVQSSKIALRQLNNVQIDLREKLQTVRYSSMDQLKRNLSQLEQLEHDIYSTDCKLAMITQENARFTQSISELETELEYIVRQKQCNTELWQRLIKELDNCRCKLVTQWINEDDIQQLVTARDLETVTNLDQVRVDASTRQLVVSGVGDRLESELTRLADFLDSVAQRRPQQQQQQQQQQWLHSLDKKQTAET